MPDSRVRFPLVLVVACVVAGPAVPSAFAQEDPAPAGMRLSFAPAPRASTDESSRAPLVVPAPVRRPGALPALYVSFAALQAMDVHSTLRGLAAGGREASPVIGGFTGNRAAMIGMKAGITTATIYLSEKLWKKNRVASIALMAAINSAYAIVVANNYRFASR